MKYITTIILGFLLIGGCTYESETICYEDLAEEYCKTKNGSVYSVQPGPLWIPNFICVIDREKSEEKWFTEEEIERCSK
jgi:hypothetical protein